jgi:hypothetical protein
MSPDWSASADPVPYADLSDPQSLNLYGYVGNNPLSQTDDDGHCYGQSQSSIWSCIGGFFHNLFAGSGDNSSVTTSQTGFVSVGPVSVNVGGVATGMATELRNEGQSAYNLRHMGSQQSPISLNNPAEKVGAALVVGGMFFLPGPDGAEGLTLAERWGPGTFETIGDSLEYHFAKHGGEVGADSMLQYLRKAEGFSNRLRGAQRVALEDGATKYIKDGKYIIMSAEKKILSFGKVGP